MTAELEGIKLDIPETRKRLAENAVRLGELEEKIAAQWSPQFEQWRLLQREQLEQRYRDMCEKFVLARDGLDYNNVWASRYQPLMETALTKVDFNLNLNSPVQLKWLLRDALGYDITDLKDDEEESTNKAVLEYLSNEYPDVGVLIKYRKAKKLQTSFYPKLLEMASFDGRIHSTFNISGARTGRLSSSRPNTQQIPKDMRDLFIAEEGNVLVDLDMSMLEPILIAYYSEDDALNNLIMSGASFHSYNAKIMFNLDCALDEVATKHKKERAAAKLAGLSILYGSGAKQLMFSLTGLGFKFNLEECKRIVYKIRDAYKGAWGFKKELDYILEQGEIAYNYMKRPIAFQDVSEIYMKGWNGLIQGSGSDIVVQSALDFCNKNPWARPRILVHDSICVEVPKDLAEEALKLLDYEMTKWKIKNRAGDISFKTEGGYSVNWKI